MCIIPSWFLWSLLHIMESFPHPNRTCRTHDSKRRCAGRVSRGPSCLAQSWHFVECRNLRMLRMKIAPTEKNLKISAEQKGQVSTRKWDGGWGGGAHFIWVLRVVKQFFSKGLILGLESLQSKTPLEGVPRFLSPQNMSYVFTRDPGVVGIFDWPFFLQCRYILLYSPSQKNCWLHLDEQTCVW